MMRRIISYINRKLLSRYRAIENSAENSAGSSAENSNVFVHKTSMVENCEFNAWVKIQKECYFYNSRVDSYTYFAGYNSVMNATIGKFCSIGSAVLIGPGKHPLDFVSTSPVFFSIHKQCGTTFADISYYKEMGSVKIGNDVWIGASSIILDDVVVGDGAVIAANSVVTSNVEPYTIVGGTPAKIIRKRFSDEIIIKLLDFRWWNKDEEWLRNNFKSFHNLEEFEMLLNKTN